MDYKEELRERIKVIWNLILVEKLDVPQTAYYFMKDINEKALSPSFKVLTDKQYKWFRSIEMEVIFMVNTLYKQPPAVILKLVQ
jgi:hypothetical protein